MKKMKRFVALALSVVMVLAMSVLVFAEGTDNSITIDNNTAGHTYEAYQIFSGDLSEGTLSNIVWGTGVTDAVNTKLGDAKTKAESLKTEEDAKTFAKAVAPYLSENKYTSTTTEDGKYIINNLPAGYYLVKDQDNTLSSKDDFYTAYIMKVVGNVTATPKGEKPSVEKKVEENTKYTEDGGYGAKYNDVADYNIGDSVPFHLIGTVPDMSGYDTYKYIFHDTLSTGLTAPETKDVKVYLSNDKTKDDSDVDITNDFTVTVNGQEITVTCNDLKKIANIAKGQYIIVEYSAVLNQNAEIGLTGNPNEVYLEYSNNPNQEGTGQTPPDKVIVFTYQLDTTKVDGQNNSTKLKDAEFKLRNSDDKWAIVDETSGKVTGWADDEAGGSTLKSNDEGIFHVIGLDAGTYYLKETKAPAGYNLLEEETQFTIKATTANGQDWAGEANNALTKLEIQVGTTSTNGDVNNGTVGITVENNKGSQLPSTGGIGTTIFYIVGGILMVGAAVLLITKRRAEN